MLTVIIIYTTLIFPIFLGIKLNLSKESKKLYFCFKIFGIKVVGGYVEILKEGIIIHLTKKFAVIIPYQKLFNMRKKVEPLKDYHFIKVDTTLKIGNNFSLLYPLSTAFVINYAYNFIGWILSCQKPYVNIFNQVDVYENEDKFELLFDATVIFNLLMILLSIIKIIIGKISYAIAK